MGEKGGLDNAAGVEAIRKHYNLHSRYSDFWQEGYQAIQLIGN